MVMSRLESLTAQLNLFYHVQLAAHFSLNTVRIRTGPTSEKWNVYANSNAITADEYIMEAYKYRQNEPITSLGATQQFITRAFSSGVVGTVSQWISGALYQDFSNALTILGT